LVRAPAHHARSTGAKGRQGGKSRTAVTLPQPRASCSTFQAQAQARFLRIAACECIGTQTRGEGSVAHACAPVSQRLSSLPHGDRLQRLRLKNALSTGFERHLSAQARASSRLHMYSWHISLDAHRRSLQRAREMRPCAEKRCTFFDNTGAYVSRTPVSRSGSARFSGPAASARDRRGNSPPSTHRPHRWPWSRPRTARCPHRRSRASSRTCADRSSPRRI
jgi:hypothetical protein